MCPRRFFSSMILIAQWSVEADVFKLKGTCALIEGACCLCWSYWQAIIVHLHWELNRMVKYTRMTIFAGPCLCKKVTDLSTFRSTLGQHSHPSFTILHCCQARWQIWRLYTLLFVSNLPSIKSHKDTDLLSATEFTAVTHSSYRTKLAEQKPNFKVTVTHSTLLETSIFCKRSSL